MRWSKREMQSLITVAPAHGSHLSRGKGWDQQRLRPSDPHLLCRTIPLRMFAPAAHQCQSAIQRPCSRQPSHAGQAAQQPRGSTREVADAWPKRPERKPTQGLTLPGVRQTLPQPGLKSTPRALGEAASHLRPTPEAAGPSDALSQIPARNGPRAGPLASF